MGKLIVIIIGMLLLISTVSSFSTDLNDYIWADIGQQQINNSIITTPANNSDIDTNGWETVEAPSWIYSTGKEGYGNISISRNLIGGVNDYDFQLNLSNVTLQLTFFDDKADTGASSTLSIKSATGVFIAFIGVVTGIDENFYVYDTLQQIAITSNISRTDDPINFTYFIAPDADYIVFRINGTKVHNFSEGLGKGLGRISMGGDPAINLDSAIDNIYLWSGTPEDRPQPSIADVTAPVVDSTSINTTSPAINEDVQISASITDETELSSIFYANNITGTFENKSSINISQASLNYTVNITNSISAPNIVGHIFTANDTSGNSVQSSVITFKSLDITLPSFQESSINNTSPKINEGVLLSRIGVDDVALSSYKFAHNLSGTMTNETIIIVEGVGLTTNLTFNLTMISGRGTVVGYQWWLNDTTANTNTSNIQTFIIANTAPTAPTIIFPTGDILTNLQPLDINITFAQDADGDTLTIEYYINGTLNQTSLTNTTLNASDNTYIIAVSVNDGTVSSSNATVTFEIDTTFPVVTITSPANLSSHSTDITVDLSCSDINPFEFNYTFFNASGHIRSGFSNTSVANVLSITDTIPIENLTDGNYNINISCADSHTKNIVGDYYPVKDLGNLKLVYTTPHDNNNIGIKLKSTTATLDDYGTEKETDRYSFWFGFVEAQSATVYTYTFKIDSRENLKYIPDSDYKAHFVTKYNWIDFEFDDNSDAVYMVTQTDENKYEIRIDTVKTYLNFNSIGGLNIVNQQINITIDTSVSAITGFAVLPLESTGNLIGMLALFVILFGVWIKVFGKKKEK